MKTFLFFTSTQVWLNRSEIMHLHSKWHEILVKFSEVEWKSFEFFWIDIIPSVVIFEDNISVYSASPYKWLDCISNFI